MNRLPSLSMAKKVGENCNGQEKFISMSGKMARAPTQRLGTRLANVIGLLVPGQPRWGLQWSHQHET